MDINNINGTLMLVKNINTGTKQIRKIEQQILFKATAWKYYNTRDLIINLINLDLIGRVAHYFL